MYVSEWMNRRVSEGKQCVCVVGERGLGGRVHCERERAFSTDSPFLLPRVEGAQERAHTAERNLVGRTSLVAFCELCVYVRVFECVIRSVSAWGSVCERARVCVCV